VLDDPYVQRLSEFDLQSKTQVDDRTVTSEEFVAYQAEQVIPFSEDDFKSLESVIRSVSAKLEAYPKLPALVPETIYLNLTTGEEEGGAAYCRGLNGMFFPINIYTGGVSLHRLFTHELWHIISRNLEKSARDQVYACIGFKPFDAPFQYPTALAKRKISNPDGPKFEHYLEFATEEGSLTALPVIYSQFPAYSKRIHNVFFAYLRVQMLVVQQNREGVWVAAPNPVDATFGLHLIDIGDLPESFWSQVGRNTNYFYHPDETVADNFVIMIHPDDQIPVTPVITQKLARIFGRDNLWNAD